MKSNYGLKIDHTHVNIFVTSISLDMKARERKHISEYQLTIKTIKVIGKPQKNKIFTKKTCFFISQDSSVGGVLDWYSEGLGFEYHHLQLNF